MKLITIIFFICISPILTIDIDIKALVAAGKIGWALFNEVFYSDKTESGRNPTELELRYTNEKGQEKQTYIHWNRKVDASMSPGPFESIQETATKLIRNNNIDIVKDCDFVYYKLRHGKKRTVSIFNDETLIILMSEKGDQDDGLTRLIDINCEQTPVRPPPDKPVTPVQMKLFKKNSKAFNHVIAVQNEKIEEQQQIANKVLKDAGIGGFNIQAKGTAILDIDQNEFEKRTKELADAYGWNDKIKKILGIVLYSGKSFSAEQEVVFDAAQWLIGGTYARFAAFRTNENKYSIYVATANFEYKVPRSAKEGSLLDYLGITDGGSIKGEYVDQIGILMEGKALYKFKIDVARPDLDDFEQ